MKLSRTQQMRMRKIVPLVVLYPLSASIGVGATVYVSHSLNDSAKTSNYAPKPVSTSVSVTPDSSILAYQKESEQVAALENRLAQINAEIQQLQNSRKGLAQSRANQSRSTNTTASGTLSSNNGSSASGVQTTQQPAPSATNPPTTHGSTGASTALG